TSHSTLMSRSRSRTLLATVRQSRPRTVSPRPRVMKPTIWSPGSGLQHFAKRTSRSSTPRMRTPWSVFGRQLVQELVHGALAVAERRQQVVAGRVPEVGRRLLDLLAREQRRRIEPVLLGLALEELAAQLDRARALLDLEPLVDLRSGACGLDDLEPVAARMLARRGDNLDDVALAERVAQRHELAVHLRADAVFPDLRVDGV